jgi:hypothetical protein
MRPINVTAPELGLIGEISLSGPVSAVVGEDGERPWGRSMRLISRGEDLLEVIGLGPDADPERVLTDLQNGLLFAETAGLRLIRTPDRIRLPQLDPDGGRSDLAGLAGRTAILAFWGGGRDTREVGQLATRQRHTAFTLTRPAGAARNRTLLSVLVPEGQAQRALEELTLFQIARARPFLLIGPPPPRPEAEEPEPGWARPGPDRFPDPRLDLDRIAITACALFRSGRVRRPERVGLAIRTALLDGWRLTSGRERPSLQVANRIRELALAAELATRSDRDRGELGPVRGLIRALGLFAWGVGLMREGARGYEPPPPRFAEEACPLMLPVPSGARAYLMSLYQGDGEQPPIPEEIEELTGQGFLDRSRLLTAAGRALVEAQLAWSAPPRPSVRSLLGPDADPWEGVPLPDPTDPAELAEPERTRRGRPRTDRSEAELAPALSRADTLQAGPPGPDGSDPFRDEALTLLTCFFRIGRDGPAAAGRSGRVQGFHAPFLSERARAIAEVTRDGRTRGETGPARALIRACAPELWRLGRSVSGGAEEPAPSRFREESSVPMRAVPEGCRWAVMALFEGGLSAPLPRGVAGALTRAGLLEGGRTGRLTAEGAAIARAELAVAAGGLPPLLSLIGAEPSGPAGPRWAAPTRPLKKEADPDPDPVPVPDPLQTAPHRPDEAVRARIRHLAADDCARYRPGPRSDDRFRALLSGTLLLCWRMGHDPDGTGRRRPPARIGHLVRERARVIELMSRPGRRSRDLPLAKALLDGCGEELWRYGALMREAPRAPAPARYREECAEPMRPAPPETRDRLLSLLERRTGRPMKDHHVRVLVREGLIEPDGLTLTAAGRLAARTERAHRNGPAPSIRVLAEEGG